MYTYRNKWTASRKRLKIHLTGVNSLYRTFFFLADMFWQLHKSGLLLLSLFFFFIFLRDFRLYNKILRDFKYVVRYTFRYFVFGVSGHFNIYFPSYIVAASNKCRRQMQLNRTWWYTQVIFHSFLQVYAHKIENNTIRRVSDSLEYICW